VGLATAYQLLERQPGLALAVVEKEAEVGAHQSSHNSGVLHAGVYYTPGSLKARLCKDGKQALEAFAERHAIPYERCGKLIVALDDRELGRLEQLRGRATDNGVAVRAVGAEELRDIEPHAAGIRALHVPGTGIIDFGRVARAYADEVVGRGGDLLVGRPVLTIAARGDYQVLDTPSGEIVARRVIACGGLYADHLARGAARLPADEQIVPFRGSYYVLRPSARRLVRGLIYPVPDPTLPFLGVHFTKRIDGEVWAGPNAVLALGRESYRRTSVNVREALDILRFPGFWRLARRYWRTGVQEVWADLAKRAYVSQLRRYVPAITAEDLAPGPSGVRAQAIRVNGDMVDDFSLVESSTIIHVRNAPSPAATASLAIGAHLAEMAIRRFELRPADHS